MNIVISQPDNYRRVFHNDGAGLSGMNKSLDNNKAVGGRLGRLRRALGFEQKRAFAKFVGVPETSWNMFEGGERRITLNEALKVCAKTGASLDWIYRDIEHTLPLHVIERLNRLDEMEQA